MNIEEAKAKILQSVKDGAKVISPAGANYEEYLNTQIELLLSSLIEPIKIQVYSASYPEYGFEKYKKSEVWAIAKVENNWLLTLAGEMNFGLAFGKNQNEIIMLGYTSPDALAEWLG
jgi:hypothetical protein